MGNLPGVQPPQVIKNAFTDFTNAQPLYSREGFDFATSLVHDPLWRDPAQSQAVNT